MTEKEIPAVLAENLKALMWGAIEAQRQGKLFEVEPADFLLMFDQIDQRSPVRAANQLVSLGIQVDDLYTAFQRAVSQYEGLRAGGVLVEEQLNKAEVECDNLRDENAEMHRRMAELLEERNESAKKLRYVTNTRNAWAMRVALNHNEAVIDCMEDIDQALEPCSAAEEAERERAG